MSVRHFALWSAILAAMAVTRTAQTANPIIPDQGVCDPHIHVFNDRAYIFTGHDNGDPEMTKWNTTDWQVWSSLDMVDWKKECVLRPQDTYIKKAGPYAWAGDGAERNGKYYFYFSNVNVDSGVAVADAPGGPYRDALGKPLLPAKLTPTRSYDPTVFIDDDKKKTPYILFGTPKWAGGDSYYIARMNEDMVSLAEPPKKLLLQNPDGTVNVADDKNFLHKRHGIYYLSWQAHYATSGNIYGPYTYRGNVGSTHDHASFCSWNNQWFMCFTIADRTGCHRAPGLCYIHYKDNGEMAPVEYEIKAYGVGRYEGTWPQIQAEWYMAAGDGISKREIPGGGFEVRAEKNGAWLSFPKVQSMLTDTPIAFRVACARQEGSQIEVRKGTAEGTFLGGCQVPFTGSGNVYKSVTCQLKNRPGQNDLCFVFRGAGEGEVLRLDWISFR